MGFLEFDKRIRVVVAANFITVAARMSLVTFLGIYFVREAGIDLATVGLAFLCENLLRGLLAPLFGALSDRVGRRPLLLAASLVTAAVLPGGRRGAYQGGWTLVSAFSMGSALFFSGLLRDAGGWQAAWAIYCGLALLAALTLSFYRAKFKSLSDSRNLTRSSISP